MDMRNPLHEKVYDEIALYAIATYIISATILVVKSDDDLNFISFKVIIFYIVGTFIMAPAIGYVVTRTLVNSIEKRRPDLINDILIEDSLGKNETIYLIKDKSVFYKIIAVFATYTATYFAFNLLLI